MKTFYKHSRVDVCGVDNIRIHNKGMLNWVVHVWTLDIKCTYVFDFHLQGRL